MSNIVLFQPEIAPNLGAIIRNAACFAANIHIIEPCGFPFDIRKIRIAAMDYIDLVKMTRHNSWSDFLKNEKPKNLVLFTTKTNNLLNKQNFLDSDYLVFGSESKGVNDEVRNSCQQQTRISITNSTRSLNLAVSVGIALYAANSQKK